MEIQFFEDTDRRELWLAQMENCSWRAGRYLYTLLKEDRFQKQYGETSRVLLLTDGEKLVSFCTYAERDEIPDTELKPWMGFVYTDPEYRGRRLMGRLIARVKELARENGSDALYISSEEQGLYEKYGGAFIRTMKTGRGEETRVFRMNTYGFYGWENALVPAPESVPPGTCTTHCGMYGKRKPARRGCRKTGARKTGRWASAPLRPSWCRIFSAGRSGACRWRKADTTASMRWTEACLT